MSPEQADDPRRHRHPHRRLLARRDALRAAHRRAPAARGDRRQRDARRAASADPGARGAAAVGALLGARRADDGDRRRALDRRRRAARGACAAISTGSCSRPSRRTAIAATARRRSSPTTSGAIWRASRWWRARRARSTAPAASFAGTSWSVGAGAVALAGLLAAVVGTAHRHGRAREPRGGDRASASREFLVDIFAETDPSNARGEAVTAREVLDRGAERVRAELASEPIVQARLEQTIGDAYDALGLYDRAEPLHRSALETLAPRARRGRSAHGGPRWARSPTAQWRLGRYDEAQPTLERVLEIRRVRLGDERSRHAQDPERSRRRPAAARRLWPPPRRCTAMGGSSCRRIHGDEHQLTLGARHNLANVLGSLGRHDEEAAHLEAVLEARRRTQGPDHPDALGAAMNLASSLPGDGTPRRGGGARRRDLRGHASRARARIIPTRCRCSGTSAASTSTSDAGTRRSNATGAWSKTRIRVLGPDHDQTLIGRRNLAYALEGAGRREEAEAQILIAAAGLAKSLGPDAFMTLDTRAQLAMVHAAMGRNQEAIARARSRAAGDREGGWARRIRRSRDILYNLACIATRVGESEQALGYLERSVGRPARRGNPHRSRSRARCARSRGSGRWPSVKASNQSS